MILDFEQQKSKRRISPEEPSDDNGLFGFSGDFEHTLKELRKQGLLRPYIVGAMRPELPADIDLLNETGAKFAKYRYFAKSYLQPYAQAIVDRYGEFINLGFKATVDEKNGDAPYRPFYPTEQVGYMSRISDLGQGMYVFDKDKQYIRINVDYPHKGEIFTKAVLERYAFLPCTNYGERGNIIESHGFAKIELNRKGQCVSSKYKPLYDGIILALSSEIIQDVTRKDPKLIVNSSQEYTCPVELMNIANEVRKIVNTNNKSQYDYKKDMLIYDLFINRNMVQTKKAINSICGLGIFELLNSMTEKLAKMERGVHFDQQYDEIKDLLKWIKEEQETA